MSSGAELAGDPHSPQTTTRLSRTRTDQGEVAPGTGRSSGKLASGVARRIEADIIRAGWPVGTVFGSEPDLIERYGVSRAVFREAVRLIEHHRVAYMRRGRSGGLIVRAPEASSVTTAVAVYLEYVGTSIDNVLHSRLIIEPVAASLAARRINEDGIAQLRAIAREDNEAGHDAASPSHHRLHRAIADLSGNPVLSLFVEVLTTLTARYVADTPGEPDPPDLTASPPAIQRAHELLVDAIVAGNSSHAEQRAVRHLEAVRAWFAGHGRRWTTGPPPPPPEPTAARPAGDTATIRELPADLPAGKTAELLADRIRSDIARAGWPVGTVFGSEPDLLARYRVSRPVLRETIRLLEHHSVAAMRRGPGGGLVVGEPDPSATAEAMARYLEYRRADLNDLRLVRTALELGCIEIVTERMTPAIVERLKQALLVDDDTPLDALGELSHFLHTELAAQTGNPALAVFVQVLTTLSTSHLTAPPGNPEHDRPGPAQLDEVAASVARTHRLIVDAIVSGDRGLARHRMLRHLEALDQWWH